MAFSGMINVKTGQLTLGGQFEAYKRGQLERNIQFTTLFLIRMQSGFNLPGILTEVVALYQMITTYLFQEIR